MLCNMVSTALHSVSNVPFGMSYGKASSGITIGSYTIGTGGIFVFIKISDTAYRAFVLAT